MKIITLSLGHLETGCYIVSSDKNNAVIIDPADNAGKILEVLSENNLTLKKILLTHGHFDHTGACADLAEKTGGEIYLHENDMCMVQDKMKNVSYLMPSFLYKPYEVKNSVTDGDEIQLDNLNFKVMHTPGHTAGSCMFICGDNIFSGDTIFCCSIGRNDFYSGDVNAQQKSLEKIYNMTGNYHIYPGHGEATNLAFEKENNDYLAAFGGKDIFGS